MPTTLEAVRPIELAEIREARERIAGTIVRTPLVRLELGPDYPGYPAQAREPAADQRLQVARRRQCRGHAARVRAQARRLDDQRGKRRTRRRLRGEKSGRALHGRGDRDGAGLEARADEGARREAHSGALRCRLEGARGAFVSRSRRDVRASVRRSQFHRRPCDHGFGDSGRRARHRRGHCRHRRRRTHHRRRQRDQGAQAGDQGLGR